MGKLNIMVLFGGKSTEYDVSCMTAPNVIENLDVEKYNIIKTGITKNGEWFVYNGSPEAIRDKSWERDTANLTPCAVLPPSGGTERGTLALFSDAAITEIGRAHV